MSRITDDPELNRVSGHSEGCLCKECIAWQGRLHLLEHHAERRMRAQELAADEAAVPVEIWQRQIAEGDHAEAIVEAHRVGEIRSKVQATRSARLHRASTLIRESRGRKLADSDFASFTKAIANVRELGEHDRELAAIEGDLLRQAQNARVISEPESYGDGSPYSWVQDTLAAQGGLTYDRAASGYQQRLQRHAEDVDRALRKRDAYGRVVERMYAEQFRQADPQLNREVVTKRLGELRALSTGGGATASASGGGAAAFVPPAFLMQQWVKYHSPYRAFANQLDSTVPLPDHGLTVYIPAFTSAATVATDVEGSPVAEGDPTSTFLSGDVVSKSGQITLSQVFLDRVGPGIAGDVLLFQQVTDQLDSQVDSYAIGLALANAQTVTNAGTFAIATASTVGGFLGDLKKGKSKLSDTAGVRIRASHLFTTSDFADYIQAYADAQGRAVFSPQLDDNQLALRAEGDPGGKSYTGYVIAGLAHHADDNIPLSGSNTQLIVARPATILLLEGPPIPTLYPQGAAGNLEAVLNVREYVTAIPKFPTGVSVVSGAAYAAAQFA